MTTSPTFSFPPHAESDPDLNALRGLPRFHELLEKMEAE